MDSTEIMTENEVRAFGVEIVCRQLEKDGWQIDFADGTASLSKPQIAAVKDGELAFFIVRTGLYPGRGRFEEGQAVYEELVQYASAHGGSCYFASVGIANADGTTEEEMSIPVKGAPFNVEFNGLVRMELPPETTPVLRH
jgi:hypothetical protein